MPIDLINQAQCCNGFDLYRYKVCNVINGHSTFKKRIGTELGQYVAEQILNYLFQWDVPTYKGPVVCEECFCDNRHPNCQVSFQIK